MRKLFLFLLVLILCGAPSAAQTTSTEVLGTVSDSTGAVVPGAKITLLRVQTGERRTSESDGSGNFSFPLIEIGDYTVSVEMAGFKTQTQTGVHVEYQQKARVNVTLDVGAASERVEVLATGVELKTDDASLGTTVDHMRVVELPTINRSFASLLVLTPGVQFGTRMGLSALSTASSFFPGATQVSANGQRDANQRVTLDGVIASEPLVNTVYFNPSIDAIEEVKVQSGSYSAEYGMNNGANVQIALKSGTNDFHGAFFEFLRNDAADAKDYFLNFQVPAGSALQSKNRLRRNQFGAWLAGPVLLPGYKGRNRTFWSFNFEGTRETQESVQQASWYPQAFRNGDFSALLTPLVRNGVPVRAPTIIYDPLTGEPFRDAQGNITNVIPPSRINKNAQNFVNTYLPLPQFAPEDILDINVIRTVPNILYQNQYFARVDHQFSANDKIFGRFATMRGDYVINNLNPSFPSTQRIQNYNVAFQHLHLFSPTTLNEFRVGFNKVNNDQTSPRSNTDFDPDTLGIGQFRVAVDNNRKFRPDETGIPPTGLGSIPGDGGARFDLNGMYQFSNNFSFIRSSHNFKTGFEFLRFGLDRAAANVPLGNEGCCPGGYALAGWLMGYPSSSSSAEGLTWTAPRQNRWGAYFQDEWRATRKLTVNMGLRWDFFQVPHDVNKKWRSLRLDILTQAADGRQLPTVVPEPNADFDFYAKDNRYFMPRVGVAYRATDKWVIRTGGGWFANVQQMNNMTILDLQPPYSGTFGFNQVDQAGLTIPYSYAGQNYTATTRRFTPGQPVLTLDNPFPGQGTPAARTNVLAFTPDNKASSVVQWSFDIQRQLFGSTIITVGYVGSKTSHIDNTIPNFNSPGPSTNTDFNNRRPFQAYVSRGEGNQARLLGNIRYLDSFANANYNALQVQVQKRYSHGITAGLAYTYGKALGEGYGRNDPAGNVQSVYQDPSDRRSNRGRYGFDVTHNAVVNYVWEVPMFTHSKGLLHAVLGGWQSSGIVTLRTGFPFALAGGNLNTNSNTYPDRVADGRLFDQATRQLWYDPTAFRRTECNIQTHPELCHYGNAASDVLITPGLKSADLSLAKNWQFGLLGEQTKLQFRAEAFNAFNTPQFGVPNGISFNSNDSIIPDGPRVGEIRSLRQPMRIFQFGLKLYF
ncbi:MAG TPA: TonB-dependent receptor [Pyrinomonadaceae bacterium]|nr:TonB-dependent receptor [Pyrinomonadaceae bacterium]